MSRRRIRVMQLGSPTGLYGAERWILALIRHLDAREVDTVVAAVKDDPNLTVPLCQEARKLGFSTRIFEAPGRFNPDAVRKIRRFILQNRVDILHTHAYKQDILGLFAVTGTSCRIVSTPHGWTQDPGAALRCYEGVNRMLFPFFDAVVPLSRPLYDPLRRMPFMGSRLHLIQNGVDTEEIARCRTLSPEMQRIREKGRFVAGYIGRLVPPKGLSTLLQAVALQKVPVDLVLVGQGESESGLRALALDLHIETQVHFMGFRDNRLEFLNGFDLFVLPSLSEGIPRCLMEAMAAGVPVLASRIPGCLDLVTEGMTGQLFAVNDADHLSRKLAWSTGHPTLCAKMAERARKQIPARFSATRLAAQYQTLFKALVRENRAPGPEQ